MVLKECQLPGFSTCSQYFSTTIAVAHHDAHDSGEEPWNATRLEIDYHSPSRRSQAGIKESRYGSQVSYAPLLGKFDLLSFCFLQGRQGRDRSNFLSSGAMILGHYRYISSHHLSQPSSEQLRSTVPLLDPEEQHSKTMYSYPTLKHKFPLYF